MRMRVFSFLWQHVLLMISLFVMTLGVALCVRSHLGCSVISTIPYVMSLAGADALVPALTLGEYTYIMNGVFVALQVLVLRRRFEPVQLFQLLVGFVFGAFIDLNMTLTEPLEMPGMAWQSALQLAGCTVMGIGIAFEIRCKSITMPGEGITVAFSRVTGAPFPKTKIVIDTTLVCLAVMLGYAFFGAWQWSAVGVGTMFAMVYVGLVVKFVNRRIDWFDRLLGYCPDMPRYIYGLARYLKRSDAETTIESTLDTAETPKHEPERCSEQG